MNYFREGRLFCPTDADNYFSAAEAAFAKKDWNIVIELVQAGMKNGVPPNWCSIFDINSYYPYWLLGASYYNIGQKEKGFAYLAIARTLTEDNDIIKSYNTARDKVMANLR